jgi:hypothetical protein
MEERRQGEETLMSPISPDTMAYEYAPDTMAYEYADGLGWYKSSKPYEFSPMSTPASAPQGRDSFPTLPQFEAFDKLLRAAIEFDKATGENTVDNVVKTWTTIVNRHFGSGSQS